MKRRWIALVALVVIAAGATALLLSRSGIEGRLRERVIQELTERLGGTVELDAVRLGDSVVLEGLRWTAADGPVERLAVARIELDVDGGGLLDGDPGVGGGGVI